MHDHVERARVAHHQEERRGGIEWIGVDRRRQVDPGQVPPHFAFCCGRGRERLHHAHHPLREARLPLVLHAVDRIAGDRTVELEHRVELLARAAAPALGVGETVLAPPVLVTRPHAGALLPHVLVHRPDQVVRRCGVDEPPAALPAGIVTQLEAAAVRLQPRARRREPVAEAPVDRSLGGPERRDRLAPLARVRELLRHQPAENPLPPVRRLDSDPRDTGTRQLAPGNRQLERVRARERDRAPVVERCHRAVKRKRDPLALPVLLRDALGEGDRHRRPELAFVGRLTDLDRHYAIFSSGA